MKPTDRRDVIEGIAIGVVIAAATAICTGLVDELRYLLDLRRKKRKRK
jgi:hypothetical protein